MKMRGSMWQWPWIIIVSNNFYFDADLKDAGLFSTSFVGLYVFIAYFCKINRKSK